ncbi:MAG: hypothetical protein EA403_08350 [Spirochaetaceae bacterium]|nr:MAG: hypothetical protein EA403_08350 [Spirochaetaceae bacterium]
MKPIYDLVTGRLLLDPDRPVPPAFQSVPRHEIDRALSRYILSVSGWRTVFAPHEESDDPQIGNADAILLACAGRVIGELLRGSAPRFPAKVVLATDSRPTGPAITNILLRSLLSMEIEVRVLGIAATPEVMAYTKVVPELDGFVYVTASHNPVGHNGLKIGLSDGAVLNKLRAEELIARFTKMVSNDSAVRTAVDAARAVPPAVLADHHVSSTQWRQQCARTYSQFVTEVITGTRGSANTGDSMEQLRRSVTRAKAGIVCDFNGSARAGSIDRFFLREMGFAFESINDQPGAITHAIIPEGESLTPCRELLSAARARSAGFIAGYTPDNDGDRGNFVLATGNGSTVTELPAQQGFALAEVAELAWYRYLNPGGGTARLAVVVNDATSLRIDAIAERFGARVYRAEVGEANVLELSSRLHAEGCVVPILGEGSNGGTIIPPSTVRDPLTAIGSLAKLLYAETDDGTRSPMAIWYRACGVSMPTGHRPTIGELLATLPAYQTTATTDPDAIMKITTTNHALLKAAYEELFPAAWEERKTELGSRFGITSWTEFNYEGADEIEGVGPSKRSGNERGGFRILFHDDAGFPIAFIWMRGSATEPVFRVLADVRSDDPEDARFLLRWHRSIIEKADSLVTKRSGHAGA